MSTIGTILASNTRTENCFMKKRKQLISIRIRIGSVSFIKRSFISILYSFSNVFQHFHESWKESTLSLRVLWALSVCACARTYDIYQQSYPRYYHPSNCTSSRFLIFSLHFIEKDKNIVSILSGRAFRQCRQRPYACMSHTAQTLCCAHMKNTTYQCHPLCGGVYRVLLFKLSKWFHVWTNEENRLT